MANVKEVELVEDWDSQEAENSQALVSLSSAEIDSQIATAKKYPRSIRRFVQEAKQMVTLNEEIASACIYALPRGGKTIEGPSARFAEIIQAAWGNCRAGARVVSEDDKFVTSQGVFIDLERNTAVTFEVKRRITTSKGVRFNDDMITVTSNAASSIAMRNAVLKGISKAFWGQLYDEAKRTAIGDAQTLSTRRTKMLVEFGKMGVTSDMIFGLLHIEGEQDITLDHLGTLRGVFTAIKEGDTTIEQAFEVPEEKPGSKAKRSAITDKLDAEQKQKAGDGLFEKGGEQYH